VSRNRGRYSRRRRDPLIGEPKKSVDLSLKDITINNALIKDGTYYLIGLNKTYEVNLIIGHSGVSVSNVGVKLTANNMLIDNKAVSFNENEDEKTLTLYWTPTDYGPYTLKGVVDYDNSVDETNEDNNNNETTVKVIEIFIDFNYTPKNPKVNQTVDFTPIIEVNGTDLSDLGEINLTWDFGDGSSEVSNKYPNHATHKYDDAWSYLVILTANSELGWSGSANHSIIINEETDYHPIARFTFSTNGTTVYFNASESYDIDGRIVEYIWDFGDGTNDSSSNPTINHTYSERGKIYTVKLIVVDDDGYTGDTIRFVSILEEGENKSIPLPPYVNILLIITTIMSITYIVRGFK